MSKNKTIAPPPQAVADLASLLDLRVIYKVPHTQYDLYESAPRRLGAGYLIYDAWQWFPHNARCIGDTVLVAEEPDAFVLTKDVDVLKPKNRKDRYRYIYRRKDRKAPLALAKVLREAYLRALVTYLNFADYAFWVPSYEKSQCFSLGLDWESRCQLSRTGGAAKLLDWLDSFSSLLFNEALKPIHKCSPDYEGLYHWCCFDMDVEVRNAAHKYGVSALVEEGRVVVECKDIPQGAFLLGVCKDIARRHGFDPE